MEWNLGVDGNENWRIFNGDALEMLKKFPDESVNMCVTSPPYMGLRDYGTGVWIGGDPNCPHFRTSKYSDRMVTGQKTMIEGGHAIGDAIYKKVCPLCGAVREDKQIGLEETPEEYIARLADVFDEVKRVLKKDGTLWVNIGDTYWGSGSKGTDFTEYFDRSGSKQSTNKGTYDMSNIPKMVGNTGSYKNKDLIGIPWMLAFELRDRGWWLRQDIIWQKINPLPSAVTDRCVSSHEYIFLLSKSKNYYFDHKAIQEDAVGYDASKADVEEIPQESMFEDEEEICYEATEEDRAKYKNLAYDGQRPNTMHERRAQGKKDVQYQKRNKRDVWSVAVKPFNEAHFATYPEKLIEPCILAGSRKGDVVLDPFNGAATTGVVCMKNDRKYIGIELNPEYIEISERRLQAVKEEVEAQKAQYNLFEMGEAI